MVKGSLAERGPGLHCNEGWNQQKEKDQPDQHELFHRNHNKT